ncbi:hypothetical protein ACMFMG_002501 [Clarireedia jacksonii]
MAKRARKLTPIVDDVRKRNRAFHDRAETVMRKSDELAVLCGGTKVWVVIEKENSYASYNASVALRARQCPPSPQFKPSGLRISLSTLVVSLTNAHKLRIQWT